MSRSSKRLLFATLVSCCIAACGGGGGGGNGTSSAAATPPPSSPPPEAGTVGDGRLGELVDWARSTQNLPAMAIIIVRAGQIAEMAAVGLRASADNTAVTTEDKWHIGSLTKAMTSTLAGVLVDQSLIAWETTPLDVWPELDADIHPGFRNITLRQLLSHTSGMRRVNEVPAAYADDTPGAAMGERRLWSADLLAEAPIGAADNFSCSNGGYVVAGAMMETVTATPWETLITQQVFEPLGMNDTGFGAPGTPGITDEPWGHWSRGAQFDAVSPGAGADNPAAMGPAGTVHTTLTDYAQFMFSHIAGARGVPGLVTQATFAILHTPLDNGSALGWGVDPGDALSRGAVLSHAGSNLRWFAVATLVPGQDVGVLVVVNAGGSRAEAAIDSLGDLLEARFEASVSVRTDRLSN